MPTPVPARGRDRREIRPPTAKQRRGGKYPTSAEVRATNASNRKNTKRNK